MLTRIVLHSLTARRHQQSTTRKFSCVDQSSHYKNTACTGGDGRRQEQKSRSASCGKVPSFGVAGTKTGEYCAQHALEEMVDVRSKKCRTASCGKVPCFGVAGTKNVKHCAQHAPEGMVNVKNKKCSIEGCGKLLYRLSELQVLKLGSTVHSTHWRGWSTSRAKSAEPKAAASNRISELQVRKRWSTVHN